MTWARGSGPRAPRTSSWFSGGGPGSWSAASLVRSCSFGGRASFPRPRPRRRLPRRVSVCVEAGPAIAKVRQYAGLTTATNKHQQTVRMTNSITTAENVGPSSFLAKLGSS